MITITELGVVRDVEWDGDNLTITITPTYTGCPAMTLFTAEIRAAVAAMGIQNLDIKTVYSPAWTTDSARRCRPRKTPPLRHCASGKNEALRPERPVRTGRCRAVPALQLHAHP